jgi:hypothetical protein
MLHRGTEESQLALLKPHFVNYCVILLTIDQKSTPSDEMLD